jgi:hypothetical protein
MAYSREKLDSVSRNSDKAEYDNIVQDLVNKVLANEIVSLAEERFVCGIIKMLRNEKNELALDIDKYKSCKDYSFRNRYLMYYNDLNGNKAIIDYYGEIPIDIKRKDVELLNNDFLNWKNYISNKTNGNDLINHISKETNQQLKDLKKFCDQRLIGSNYRNYLEKSITLHGKFIYLLVKEYYQELGANEQIIIINGEKILIDSYTYVHIMFRHYSKSIKQHLNGKSYHFDENIGFKFIPNFLFDLLTYYESDEISKQFNNYSLYFQLNAKPYAIYLKPTERQLKGNIKIKYFRVQTFYPIEEASELKKVESFQVYKTGCRFDFLI